MRIVSRFNERFPDIEIRLNRAFSRNQYRQLKEGRFDIIQTGISNIRGETDIEIAGRSIERLCVIAYEKNPLTRKRVVCQKDMLSYPNILAEHDNASTLEEAYPAATQRK